MIVYSATKLKFINDVHQGAIEEIILDIFKKKHDKSVGVGEFNSWKNSLQYMSNVLTTPDIPDDAGVAIEYSIPQTSKRIDFVLTGVGGNKDDTAIIVELKQWSEVEGTSKDAIVKTYINKSEIETAHPSYQAWSYAALLEDFNEVVQQDEVRLIPCAYLHNCKSDIVVRNPFYQAHTEKAPVFIKGEALKLREFIAKYVKYGDSNNLLYRIESGRIKPSKSLADSLLSMLKGNDEFLLIDDQKLVYETALAQAKEAYQGGKRVLIVEGGPGTGKTVVAINILVALTANGYVSQYVSKNAAPRAVYESKLSGSFTKSRISNLFKGSGAYIEAERNEIDVLITDEAHRLNEKSGMYQNLGENQVKEIINASKLSVFFIDEDQRVTFKDIGHKAEIRKWAQVLGAEVHEMNLQSQFRCNGSDGYLSWLDNTLQVRDTANLTLEGVDYDFKVVRSPSDLRDLIFEKNAVNNKARLVAGYCWDWKSKKINGAYDIEFPQFGFGMQWNLASDGSLWIAKPDSVSEIGCIHTCQGLELDSIGVIVGPDLLVRNGEIRTDAGQRSGMDSSVKGYKKMLKSDPIMARTLADRIIKNTYRTLMTRGQKGCYIYCTDDETAEYFENATGVSATLAAT